MWKKQKQKQNVLAISAAPNKNGQTTQAVYALELKGFNYRLSNYQRRTL